MDIKLTLSILVLLITFIVFSGSDVVAIGGSLIGAVIMTGIVVYSAGYIISYSKTTENTEEIVVEEQEYIPIERDTPLSLGVESRNFIRGASKEENQFLADMFLEQLESEGRVTDTLVREIESLFDQFKDVERVTVKGSKGSPSNSSVSLFVRTYNNNNDLMKVFIISGTAD